MGGAWTRSQNEVLATLQDVVATESVNPGLPGGQRGESAMVEYISEFFRNAGMGCETREVLPGRSNLIGTLEGRNPERVLLFECHLDTASVGVMTIPPFEPHIRDGLLYGRGSCDTKAGGVAMIHAMKRLKESGQIPPCTIQFAGAVDEEYLFRGALSLAATVKSEAVVVAEPTDLAVIRAHKGLARFRIRVEGVAAHSSKPHLGINAIVKMARLITDIEREILPSLRRKDHPLTGGPTLNIGVIHGGAQVNFVPHECVVEVDRRTIPGESPQETLAEFEEALERARAADPEVEGEPGGALPAGQCHGDSRGISHRASGLRGHPGDPGELHHCRCSLRHRRQQVHLGGNPGHRAWAGEHRPRLTGPWSGWSAPKSCRPPRSTSP